MLEFGTKKNGLNVLSRSAKPLIVHYKATVMETDPVELEGTHIPHRQLFQHKSIIENGL